ncbi:hypothetical protein Poli38472_002089 [Pythium oligandrum]|uniref:Uncharacterized protein n=1 Tax=Pythium oligandrum TaxID=41045 RepID=A0A8K1FLY3_PYTOL|nr:hypothetical protein Poli38472_002089 [Pythium oligandrum]|eukprot:TMW63148.1 hypothetical protein Poli38472_002089 [Pythium oligandrum]
MDVRRRFAHVLEKAQVELQGHYSVDRQSALQAYTETTTALRVVSVLLLTPLPCLIIIILADVPPLEDPKEGSAANYVFWIRAAFVIGMLGAFSLHLFSHQVQSLPLRGADVVVVGLTASFVATASNYALSTVVGFPLPFLVVFSSLPFMLVILTSIAILWGRQLSHSPEARKQLPTSIGVVMTLWALTFVYPAYNAVYVKLHGAAQGAFVLLFPVVKLVMANVLAHFCPYLQDATPEMVVMSVEIFHALFSTYCMQGSTSLWTVAVIIGVDVLHALHSLAHVNRIASEIRETEEYSLFEWPAFAWCRRRLNRVGPSTNDVSPRRIGATKPPKSSDQVVSRTASIVKMEDAHADEKMRQLLYLTEFVILVEYVEIIIPFIYGAYLVVCMQLPNHVYYPQLRDLEPSRLSAVVSNVLVYTLLELVSLVILSVVLRPKLSFSPIYQLAFVLETQWLQVQLKITFWVLYVVTQTLEHAGGDYTFQFKWLRDTKS